MRHKHDKHHLLKAFAFHNRWCLFIRILLLKSKVLTLTFLIITNDYSAPLLTNCELLEALPAADKVTLIASFDSSTSCCNSLLSPNKLFACVSSLLSSSKPFTISVAKIHMHRHFQHTLFFYNTFNYID